MYYLDNKVTIFNEYINKYEPCEAIFKLQLSPTKKNINCLQYKNYQLSVEIDETDHIATLINDCIKQRFSLEDGFTIDQNYTISEAIARIRNRFCVFIEKNLSTVSPRQTKLYKWFHCLRTHYFENDQSDTSAGLILLYSYMMSVADCNGVMTGSEDHKNNVLILMESFKEKYAN